MAGKSYARNKRKRKPGKAWHKGKIAHGLCKQTQTNAQMNPPSVKGNIKAGFTQEKRYASSPGVKCVNKPSKARQPLSPAYSESSADDSSISSAFDGNYVDNLGEIVGQEMTYPVQYDQEYEFEQSSIREIDSEEWKTLRKMTRKAYRQIRTMEAGIWIGRSLAPKKTLKRDIRHSRPPHWRDWTPVPHDVRPLRDGDGVGDAPLRPKMPREKSPLGTGLDVESRAQMNASFEKFIGDRS